MRHKRCLDAPSPAVAAAMFDGDAAPRHFIGYLLPVFDTERGAH
jgi:hypothetical protein